MRAAKDQFGLKQARLLSQAGARMSRHQLKPLQYTQAKALHVGSAHPSPVESKPLFVVDTDGDPALVNCERLDTPFLLRREEEILGSSYYSQSPIFKRLSSSFELCDEQKVLVGVIEGGYNVFYTGSAGTGKSTVLHAFVRELRAHGKSVRIVGPTGISALNIRGQTISAFAGLTPALSWLSIESLEHKARIGKRWERINATDVIVIDEVSMVDSYLFGRLDRMCRAARQPRLIPVWKIDEQGEKIRCYVEDLEEWKRLGYGENTRSRHDPDLPFGGMQVIVTGDFCQLPPVRPFMNCATCGKVSQQPKNGPWLCPGKRCETVIDVDDCWAFRSDSWTSCSFKTFQLTQIHRQADHRFVAILETLRASLDLSLDHLQVLMGNTCSDLEGAIAIFPTNREADKLNDERFAEIQQPVNKFGCVDDFQGGNSMNDEYTEERSRGRDLSLIKELRDHRLKDYLSLKVGMPVMLLVNGPPGSGLVNGSQGTLIGFVPYERAPGALNPDSVPDGTQSEFDDDADYKDDRINEWFAGNMEFGRGKVEALPLVEFLDGQREVIFPSCDVEKFGDHLPQAIRSRTQLPLRPAWAITIHKSQGLTLDRLIVNLDRAWQREQVYVALSRVRSLEGLRLESQDGLAVLQSNGKLGPGNAVVKAFLEKCFGKPKLSTNGLA